MWPKPSFSAGQDSLKYVDASGFLLIGKGFTDTKTRYERLPAYLEDKTRPAIWALSKHCSGLAVRFHTNSRIIAVKWELTENIDKKYFAATGFKGLDLYCLELGKWQYVGTGIPESKKTNSIIINHMNGTDKEYLLYLPLYDGLANIEIGVSPTAIIGCSLIDSPRMDRPVVFYGTSITQGGCVSRAGMSYPNQLSRLLDRQIINLGFTGNGQLDLEIAEAMADIDASCFVIDCLPNALLNQMNERYVRFVEILRGKNSSVPILLVENIHFPAMAFDQQVSVTVKEKNKALQQIYSSLKGNGDRHVFYSKSDKLIGDDFEGTVEGIHLTDLGSYRMSQNLYPILKKLVK